MLQYFLCFQIQFATIHRYYDKHIQMINDYRFTQDSIMSLDISFSRVSRCLPNSSSGQWRSLMKVCKASSFQKRSSEVPEPLLQGQMSEFSILKTRKRENNAFFFILSSDGPLHSRFHVLYGDYMHTVLSWSRITNCSVSKRENVCSCNVCHSHTRQY